MVAFGEMSPYFKVKTTSELLHKRGPAVYNSGLNDRDKGFVKYGPKSSDNPTLMIVNAIYDDNGDVIVPGYYELVLSWDRTMLVLAQSGKIIATVPVFKMEEDKTQGPVAQPIDNKSQRKFDKSKKELEKKNKKLVAEGKITDAEPQIYSNATIEYDKEGDYYLIKYERDRIRAWGAIK